MDGSIGQVSGAPKQVVEYTGLDHDTLDEVPPALGQLKYLRLSPFPLDDAQKQPSQAKGKAPTSEARFAAKEGEPEQDEQGEAENWIYYGDVVPSHPHIGERPKQISAVTGACIEQAVRAIGESGQGPHPPKGGFLAKEGPKGGGHEQAAARYEDQGMSELPMELEPEQRVIGGADENVEVGQEAGRETNEQGAPSFLLVASASSGEGSPDQALGERIHGQPRRARAAKVTTTGT
jgi:hypothetical protein